MISQKERYQNRTEILQGTLDMLILQTLRFAVRRSEPVETSTPKDGPP